MYSLSIVLLRILYRRRWLLQIYSIFSEFCNDSYYLLPVFISAKTRNRRPIQLWQSGRRWGSYNVFKSLKSFDQTLWGIPRTIAINAPDATFSSFSIQKSFCVFSSASLTARYYTPVVSSIHLLSCLINNVAPKFISTKTKRQFSHSQLLQKWNFLLWRMRYCKHLLPIQCKAELKCFIRLSFSDSSSIIFLPFHHGLLEILYRNKSYEHINFLIRDFLYLTDFE